MAWTRLRDYTIFRSPIVRACLAIWLLLAIAVVSMAPRVKRRYDRWSAARFASRASDFLSKGDYNHALLDARSALELNRQNAEAIRVIAQSLEAVGSADAIQWRRQFDLIQPGSPENTLAWARDAFQAGDFEVAERVLGTLKPADRSGTFYHDIAARVAMGKGDLSGAETHWAEAAKLDPGNDQYRLNVSTLRLRSRVPAIRDAALAALRELGDHSDRRMQALRTLLGDAVDHQETGRAKELAKVIATDPQATFADRVARLETLRAMRDPEATPLLIEMRDRAVANPPDLSQLLTWMNRHNLALMVSEWSSSLPPGAIARPSVSVALAEAYDRSMEWKRLGEFIGTAEWGPSEFLRNAYRARVLAKADDAAGATTAWEAAIALARKHPDQLETLTNVAMHWGWKEKAHEVAGVLADNERCPRWVLDSLWATALRRGESAELFRLGKLLARADPKNITHRNNAIFLGLLIHSTEAKLHELAEALYRDAPDNANVVATFALSCYQRGRIAEAVSLMETLKPEQLHEPGTARYYGIFLASAKKTEQSRAWLEIGEKGEMLPEEKNLILGARADSTKESATYLAQLDQFAKTRPDELAERLIWMNSHDLSALVSAWSSGLPPETAGKPKVAMAIAEASVKALDWARIRKLTASASWNELDYMRNAYLARALDRMEDAAGSELAWKAAMDGARANVRSLEAIAKVVKGWGWETKYDEALWTLAATPDCPRWAVDALWENAIQGGDFTQLRKTAKLITAADSKGTRTRNNAVVLALLTHTNEVPFQELAESLFSESPADASLAAIHALSLHVQGRTAEALAMMERFAPGQLSDPKAAFYYGIFLTAANQDGKAQDYLDVSGTSTALNIEEKMLVTRARRAAKSGSPQAPSESPK